MLTLAFFACCFLVLYPYVVYPVLLKALCLFRSRAIPAGDGMPGMTMIISAFNEEDVIAEKVENTLALDYPKENLEIIVVSDHSNDRTDEIVKRYEDQGVLLLALPVRQGKTAGLNEAVRKARGEILVFSDADSLYKPDALRIIAGSLAGDGSVGLVTGSTDYASRGEGRMVVTTSIYTRFERFLKRHESLLGSCVGADGALFGMRKDLYQPLQQDDINDLVLPMKVVKQGYRVVLHEDLLCFEAPAADEGGEFKRQARITNRTLRALFRNAGLMNVFTYPLFSFELISHKLLKLCAPLFMLSLLPLNILLLGQGPVYMATFAVQIASYGLCLIRLWQERTGKKHMFFALVKKVQDAGYRFVEVPVHHYYRQYGESQFFNFARVGATLVRVFQWWWRLVVKKEAIKAYRVKREAQLAARRVQPAVQ